MADLFLREVKRIHQLRQDINEMTPEEADELIRGLTRPRIGSLPRAMHNCRRPTCHGAGCFSAAAAPANRTRCRRQCTRRSAPVSSASTLLRQPRPTFTTSISKVRAASSRPAAATRARAGCHRDGGWNGRTVAMCVFFSGEEPESLRGPQCELCIIDEIGRMRYQQSYSIP